MRIVPQIDTYPRLIAAGQTRLGKIGIVIAFGLALRVDGVDQWLFLTATAGVLTFLPSYRGLLVAAAGLVWLGLQHFWTIPPSVVHRVVGSQVSELTAAVGGALLLAAMFLGMALFMRQVHDQRASWLGRHPVLALVGGYLVLVWWGGVMPGGGGAYLVVWAVIGLLGPYLWYFSYALQDASGKAPDPFPVQVGTFRPFYLASYSTSTPIGKGRAYLRKVEARTPAALSVTQLKAVKLLIWVAVLIVVYKAQLFFLRGEPFPKLQMLFDRLGLPLPTLGGPSLDAAIRHTGLGTPVPIGVAWISVVGHFTEVLLDLAIGGGIAVACCRMAGFAILRNTYRPLESRTIADFWNRYYFYFKELLVDFFFFPTYLRYFKQYRRLRTFAATIAAATVGNLIYHFCRDVRYVAEMGLTRAVAGYQVYAFYALCLGVGIGLSQLRQRPAGPAARPTFARRLLASAVALGFFCVLEVFDYEPRDHTLALHLRFFLHLFGLSA